MHGSRPSPFSGPTRTAPGSGLSVPSRRPCPSSSLVTGLVKATWWAPSSSTNPWTPHSFLSSKYGAHLDLASDAATREALAEVLPRLLDEDVDTLRHLGRIDAARLHARVMPDPVRNLLGWIDDPNATRERLTAAEWTAFSHTCRETYRLDPDKDTAITAAGRLGAREGEWAAVWQRFAEAARRYPGIHTALDQARPPSTLLDEDPHPDSWPSWNREQEDVLRSALAGLVELPDAATARQRLLTLATEHTHRRETVWGELGQAPLADAVTPLGRLGEAATDLTATDVASAAAWYAAQGYVVDRLALEARAVVAANTDREAVFAALHAVYDPWADRNARTFQSLVRADGYAGTTGLDVAPGTCVVYVDALRLDLAHRLADKLASCTVEICHRLAAFPTVTPTGQPAVTPVDAATRSGWGPGAGFEASDAQGTGPSEGMPSALSSARPASSTSTGAAASASPPAKRGPPPTTSIPQGTPPRAPGSRTSSRGCSTESAHASRHCCRPGGAASRS